MPSLPERERFSTMPGQDELLVRTETIGYLVVFGVFVWWAYKAYRVDEETGTDLPIDPRRLLRPWRGFLMTGRALATITRVELLGPSTFVKFGALTHVPWNVEVYFDYPAGDSKYSGKFRVLAPGDLWESELSRLKQTHGESVLVQFNPGRPEECEPVENKWNGWRIWTAGP